MSIRKALTRRIFKRKNIDQDLNNQSAAAVMNECFVELQFNDYGASKTEHQVRSEMMEAAISRTGQRSPRELVKLYNATEALVKLIEQRKLI